MLEVVLLATVLLLLYVLCRKPTNYPPGPISMPLLGSIPALALSPGKTPHDKMWNLAKKYGPLTGVFLGLKPTVIVSGYKAIKHVLGREDLSYRPDIVPVNAHFFNRRLGVFFTDGPAWKEQRRFTLRHLRDFGFGRSTMEALIHEETRALLETMDKLCKQPHFEFLPLLHVHAINILWAIMAGKRHDVDDENFLVLTRAVLDFFRYGDPLNIANNYPTLQKMPYFNISFNRQFSAVRKTQDFIEATVKEHMENYDENHPRDFIDIYIKEMNLQSSGKKSSFEVDQLTMICMDLFNAGTETTASTIGYCVRYMVQYPHIQSKLREELLREVGTGRLPSMEDMNKLHYGQAVLNEVFRHSGLAPFTVPHATGEKADVYGYTLPKDTLLLVNLWTVHMDPEIWGDPDNFRPERFIDEDGKYHKSEYLMAFGMGPRMCLGEPLARYSTFLIFTALVQNFEITPPAGAPPPSSEQLQGFTTSPAPYLVAVKPA